MRQWGRLGLVRRPVLGRLPDPVCRWMVYIYQSRRRCRIRAVQVYRARNLLRRGRKGVQTGQFKYLFRTRVLLRNASFLSLVMPCLPFLCTRRLSLLASLCAQCLNPNPYTRRLSLLDSMRPPPSSLMSVKLSGHAAYPKSNAAVSQPTITEGEGAMSEGGSELHSTITAEPTITEGENGQPTVTVSFAHALPPPPSLLDSRRKTPTSLLSTKIAATAAGHHIPGFLSTDSTPSAAAAVQAKEFMYPSDITPASSSSEPVSPPSQRPNMIELRILEARNLPPRKAFSSPPPSPYCVVSLHEAAACGGIDDMGMKARHSVSPHYVTQQVEPSFNPVWGAPIELASAYFRSRNDDNAMSLKPLRGEPVSLLITLHDAGTALTKKGAFVGQVALIDIKPGFNAARWLSLQLRDGSPCLDHQVERFPPRFRKAPNHALSHQPYAMNQKHSQLDVTLNPKSQMPNPQP